jgi:hypothetical protein
MKVVKVVMNGWRDGCDEDSPGSGSGGWPTVTGTGGLLILEAAGQSRGGRQNEVSNPCRRTGPMR